MADNVDNAAFPGAAVRRRRRVNTDVEPQVAAHSEIIPYKSGGEVAPTGDVGVEGGGRGSAPGVDERAVDESIGEGRIFTRPAQEFAHWQEILDAVFAEFVERSSAFDSSAEAEKEPGRYFEMVNAVTTKNPQWQVQPIDLKRLVELLRVYQFGYGPLEEFMHIEGLEELYFNRFDQGFYIERGRKHRIREAVFENRQTLVDFVDHVARENGLSINAEKPNLDATLKDGSRLNATLEPLAVDGPDFVIRKFAELPFTIEDYIATGMLTKELAEDLRKWVLTGLNLVVSGGTSSGKTTLLNTIGNSFIPKSDRILVLENRKELQIYTEDTKYFQTREDATRENQDSDVGMKDIIRWCLRKRPDRIIVGEVRGGEAYYALVAWNSGHDGSFCTIHADNAASAIDKLEQLAMEGGKLSEAAVTKQIARSVDIVIQVERIKGRGERHITEVAQVFHPRKYNRRLTDVAARVAALSEENAENGMYRFSHDLWLLPLYELDANNQLVKLNELIPIQGKS
jgi:Flp pilus assembly CpaF family ATPase